MQTTKSVTFELETHLNRVHSIKISGGDGGSSNDDNHQGCTLQRRSSRDWQTIDLCKLNLKNPISSGNFSSVFRASYDGKEVVVKSLEMGQESQSTKDLLKKAFDQEASMWSRMNHPNIVKFIGASQNDDDPSTSENLSFMVAEYLPRGTLKSYLIRKSRTKLSLKIVIELALDLARGLAYLHSNNIVHRDIKSENLLLDNNGQLKIADFGVTRLVNSEQSEMTGQTGTFGYMAPEVLEGKPYGTKCDVYSFGICLWEIYCCDMPFSPSNFADVSSAIVNKGLRPRIPKCCPKPLAKIMRMCWSANPEKRPDMNEVISCLSGIDTSNGGNMIPDDQAQCSCFPIRL